MFLKNTLIAKPWLPLGIYYENLWHFLIRQHSQLELLAHNLQVVREHQDTRTTLGEFDLIYRFNQQIVHRELAVKFYLGVPASDSSASPWQQWVGPGLKDRLDRKMHRLLNHQILLSDTPEGRQTLAEFDPGLVKKDILVQGRLFYPMFADCPPPVNSHPDHLRGYWLTCSEYKNWLNQKQPFDSLILNKPFWLNNEEPVSDFSLTEHLDKLCRKKRPQMVKCQNQYLFVVPDNWPEQAMLCAGENHR